MRYKNCGYILIVLLSLTACGSGKWFGGSDDNEKLKGTRIDALKTDNTLKVDIKAKSLPTNLGNLLTNKSWHRSQGYGVSGNLNLKLSESQENIDIGASKGDYHLAVTPVIGQNTIYTIDGDGVVLAHGIDNIKKQLWKYKIKLSSKTKEAFLSAGMTFSDGVLYITTASVKVLALDAKLGTLLWERDLTSTASSAPDIFENLVYVNTIDNNLYALNKNDGSIIWTQAGVFSDVTTLGTAAPLAKQGIVVAPYSSGEMFVLDAFTGHELWSDNLTTYNRTYFSLTDLDASPVMYKNMLIEASQEGMLVAFDLSTGARIWQQEMSTSVTPWVAGDFLYVLTKQSQLVGIYLPTGSIKFVKQLDSYKDSDKTKPIFWNGPVVANNLVWVVNSEGQLKALSPDNGEQIQEIAVPKNIYLPPVIAEGKIFLLSDKGKLIRL